MLPLIVVTDHFDVTEDTGVNMKTFTHPVGDSHLYQLSPLKTDGTAGTITADTTYAVDLPAIASINPNEAVGGVLQVTVNYLAAGTATITATGTNEHGATFTTQFQAIVTAVPVNQTDHFDVEEIS